MFNFQVVSGIPIFEQLEAKIAGLIISGEMPAHEKLPPVREVAKQLAVNPNTVQKSYGKLEQRGLIYSLPGKGSYVSEKDKYISEVKAVAAGRFKDAVNEAVNNGLTLSDMIEILHEMEGKQ